MTAILRRELSAYFFSPIGYVFLSVFYLVSGIFFFVFCVFSNSTDLTPVFSFLFYIVLFLIPILTMRLLSEDKKHKTDQALLTAPVSLAGLVLGKFLAALVVFLMGLSVVLVFALIIAGFTTPNWPSVFGNFFAILLLGAALISVGMLMSSLTENQVVAAVLAFFINLALMLVDVLAGMFHNMFANPIVGNLMLQMSYFTRYNNFTTGKFDLSDALFFLSATAIFVFLTVRVLEKRRWS